ncbi:MAG: DUF503 domain-containing protein [Deltaproteobacteria bacterium]|nr:DUF503 domain-containing protein [Deltaproteobacteria bacterium]
MFVGIARVTLSIPGAASLKDKRQVVRKLLDRARAKFNVAAAEVADNDLWQKAVLGFCVVGNERSFVSESVDNILHFVEEAYLAPVVDRQVEILAMGGGLFGSQAIGQGGLTIDAGNRTLAEAEAEQAESGEGDEGDWEGEDEGWDEPEEDQ